jgi:hypothetical protein
MSSLSSHLSKELMSLIDDDDPAAEIVTSQDSEIKRLVLVGAGHAHVGDIQRVCVFPE